MENETKKNYGGWTIAGRRHFYIIDDYLQDWMKEQ